MKIRPHTSQFKRIKGDNYLERIKILNYFREIFSIDFRIPRENVALRKGHGQVQLVHSCVSGILITFAKHENVIEVPAGSSAQIMCQTKSPIRECQWSWRQLNQSQPWNLDVKSFPAFGNDSTECSIKFKNVLPEQEGYWTCGARIDPNFSFTQATPVRFLISEGIALINYVIIFSRFNVCFYIDVTFILRVQKDYITNNYRENIIREIIIIIYYLFHVCFGVGALEFYSDNINIRHFKSWRMISFENLVFLKFSLNYL